MLRHANDYLAMTRRNANMFQLDEVEASFSWINKLKGSMDKKLQIERNNIEGNVETP